MTLDLTHTLWLATGAAMLAAAVWHDAVAQRIPNRVVLCGLLAALVLSALPAGIGLGSALAGLVTGLLVMLPLHLLRVMGAGDVKLFAAVGAFIGFPGVLGAALATFIAGGLLALLWAVRTRRLGAVLANLRTGLFVVLADVAARSLPRADAVPVSPARIPYAIAIAAGAVAQVLLSTHWVGQNIF